MKHFITAFKWITVTFGLAFVACTTHRVPSADIDALNAAELTKSKGQEFSRAVVRASASGWAPAEVDALVGQYTDDAILFPPKGDPIRGRDAIRAHWTRTSDRKVLEHSIETEGADASGDLLVDHGRVSLVSESGSSPPERYSLNFISAWKRGPDGVWRKSLDSWWFQ